MDFRQVIESTRQNVRWAQASYSESNWLADRIRKPFAFYVTMDRRFDQQFRDQRILLQRGIVVWGAIIQANAILFEPKGRHPNLPAALIYSEDRVYDANPEYLIDHAHSMYELKGEACSPEMQAFGDKLANEFVMDIKLPIPQGFTDGIQCYYATLLIARKHLPGNYLANGFFPVLIAPQETDVAMVLPAAYWDSKFAPA